MRAIKANVLLAAVLLITLATGCTKSSAPLNSANVMFVNGCLAASSVSVKANNTNVDGASSIGFLTGSAYKYVTAGNGVNLTFYLDYAGTPFTNRTVNLAAPNHYSVFIGGSVASPLYVFATDDLTPPSKGNAKVRFVNLSPDNINETVTANDSIILQGVNLNNVSAFQQLRAGKYALGMFDPANADATTTTDSTEILAGKIYTILLTGSQLYTGASDLTLSFINNN